MYDCRRDQMTKTEINIRVSLRPYISTMSEAHITKSVLTDREMTNRKLTA